MVTEQYNTLAGKAAAFAVRAHDGQVRTGTNFPYVVHPIGVGHLLRNFYPDDEVLEAAGYLHDVVEDTDYTIDTIENKFGSDVSFLVAAVTRRPGWDLDASNKDVMRLKSADVIDNVLDTIRGLEKGHDVWSRFSAGRKKVVYWRRIAVLAYETIDGEPILDLLEDSVTNASTWAGRF